MNPQSLANWYLTAYVIRKYWKYLTGYQLEFLQESEISSEMMDISVLHLSSNASGQHLESSLGAHDATDLEQDSWVMVSKEPIKLTCQFQGSVSGRFESGLLSDMLCLSRVWPWATDRSILACQIRPWQLALALHKDGQQAS